MGRIDHTEDYLSDRQTALGSVMHTSRVPESAILLAVCNTVSTGRQCHVYGRPLCRGHALAWRQRRNDNKSEITQAEKKLFLFVCICISDLSPSVPHSSPLLSSPRLPSLPMRSTDHTRKLLRIAHRFYPNATPFIAYIHQLNTTLTTPITLHQPQDPPNYTRLLDNLFLDPPSNLPNLHETRTNVIPLDQLLTSIITSLFRNQSPYIVHRTNVFTAGLFPARETGAASVLRNIDARAPSAPLHQLRSPSWQLLYRRIGHVLFRHLLLHSTLLFAVPTSHNTPIFLQLTGPIPTPNDLTLKRRLTRSASNIVLRRDLLYHNPSRRPTSNANSGLPPANHLHHLHPQDSRQLLRLIFPALFRPSPLNRLRRYDSLASEIRSASPAPRRHLKRLKRIQPILRCVIERTRKRSFRRLLGHYCPLPNTETASAAALIGMHTSPKRVALFLCACLRQIVPNHMFGSSRNRHVLESAVHHFVRKRLQKESFDIARFFNRNGLCIKDIPWLHLSNEKVVNPTDLRYRYDRVHELIIWIFRGLLIPLVQHNFYPTESNMHRNRIFFFRREIWFRLIDPAADNILRQSGQFQVLSREQLAASISQRAQLLTRLRSKIDSLPVLYYHQLRQIPKKSSLRGIQRPRVKLLTNIQRRREDGAIAKPSKRTAVTLNKARASTDSFLYSILRIILAECKLHPSLLGASVSSLDDIYMHFIDLKTKWNKMHKPKMYVCCFDITKSFDTIPLATLLDDVIPSIFTRDRYVLMRYRLSQPEVTTRRVAHRYTTHVCMNPGDETSFLRLLKDNLSPFHAGGLFSDLAHSTTLERSDILATLQEFLTNNLISVPPRNRKQAESQFALQCRGLPQGHQLSPTLTALFYALVERQDLMTFLPTNYVSSRDNDSKLHLNSIFQRVAGMRSQKSTDEIFLLMRLIDDTMLITSDKNKAEQFMKRMVEGWTASHGYSINVDKSRASFKTGEEYADNPEYRQMPWCGLFLDVSNLEFRADYTRYKSRNGRLRDYIMVEHDLQPGRVFSERACTCFNPKIHPLLLDSRINSKNTVMLNIYQAAVLSSMKLCAYFLELRPHQSDFFPAVVEATMSNFVTLVQRAPSRQKARAQGCKFELKTQEVRYLCSHAFHMAIANKLLSSKVHRESARKSVDKLFQKIKQDSSTQSLKRKNYVVEWAEASSRKVCHELLTIPL